MPDLLMPTAVDLIGHDIPDGLPPDPRLYPGMWRFWWLTVRDDRAHLAAQPTWFCTSLMILGPHAYALDFARALEELRHART